jgi:DNA (cytosine-5)-methyltransferase 1
MRHGSLFSGIGGFDLAAQWLGWENVFHCEKEPFCQKVLNYYWPGAELFTDITKADFKKYANTIDILTGGFPCQPYSLAGKRKGKEDERHLWPEMLRAIREIQPRWVVGENVPGLISWKRGVVFDEVQIDLEHSGYEVFPAIEIPACAKDKPHRRNRLWIVAHANDKGLQVERKLSRLYETEREALPGIERGNGLGQIWSKETGYVEPPLCRTGHGIPKRVDRIKALGNAVVPQVVYEIFKAIEQYELLMNSSNADSNTKQIEP